MMKKVYRFTYSEAIHALNKLHPELVPPESEWLPPHKRDSNYVEVEFEIEPQVVNVEQPKLRIDGPITTIIETRATHTDDGYPI